MGKLTPLHSVVINELNILFFQLIEQVTRPAGLLSIIYFKTGSYKFTTTAHPWEVRMVH